MNLSKKITSFIIISGIFFADYVYAVSFANPLAADSFAELVDKIATLVLNIGSVVAVVMIIWAGFLFVTARGSEQQLKKAKSTFQWTIIGAVVLLGSSVIAKAIVNFVEGL